MRWNRATVESAVTAIVMVVAGGPIIGFLCALPIAALAFWVTSLEPASLIFAAGGSVSFGCPVGFVFMLLVYWSIRKENLAVALRYLVGGTLAFGLPVALIPNAAFFALLSSMIGFWVGYALLLRNINAESERRFAATLTTDALVLDAMEARRADAVKRYRDFRTAEIALWALVLLWALVNCAALAVTFSGLSAWSVRTLFDESRSLIASMLFLCVLAVVGVRQRRNFRTRTEHYEKETQRLRFQSDSNRPL